MKMENSKNLLNKKKLAITLSVILGSTMLSPYLFANTTSMNNTTDVAVMTLPNLANIIKENRSAVVSIDVDYDRQAGITNDPDLTQLDRLPNELRDLFRNMPQRKFPIGAHVQTHGSGFIISKDGYVVTNAHVVDNANKIMVKLEDNRTLKAKIIGIDKLSDIALLKIDASNLSTVSFGDSDNLDVGQWVVAIGTPFGLDYTATQGIVSALSRSLPSETYVPFIQTDAAVNPGSSGGPLFNLKGQVVGVNSQIFSRSGGYMGVSFAIPINIVKNVTEQLKSTGSVSRGWLGVGIQGVDQNLAKSFGISNTEGSLITSVSAHSPAEIAGLKAGDVIIRFDNQAVKSVKDLPLLVGSTVIGKKVPITILRAGKESILHVTIDKLANKDEASPVIASLQKGMLGIAISKLSREQQATLKDKNQGVFIEDVMSNSPAENAGLEVGDILLSINGKSIESPAMLKTIIQHADTDKPLAILLKRNDQALFIAVQLDS